MRNRLINIELGLFLLAFITALAIRLTGLSRNPLTNAEAAWALQALELARGGSPVLGGQPGYIVLTAFLFFLTDASEIAARFLPAIAGSLIVWAAYLFRPLLGRVPALFLAFFLAVEPGLVAVSRQADGLMFAVAFSLLSAGFLYRRKAIPGGIFAGLALLGGPGIWLGLLIVTLAHFSFRLLIGKRTSALEGEPDDFDIVITTWPWRKSLPWLVGTMVILGTMFLWVPAGISAIFTSLIAFLNGWAQPVVFPAGRMLIALVAYAPLGVILGGAGLIHASFSRHRVDLFLVFWFLTAVLMVLIYPGRGAPDLVWALIPLWALAARQSDRFLQLARSDLSVFSGQFVLVFVLLIFAWLNFVFLSNQIPGTQESQFRWLSIAGSMLMMLVVAILVAWGWSSQSAAGGLVWGVVAVLIIFTISSSVNAGGLGRRPDAEMWNRSPYIDQADLLLMTTTQMSQWNTRARDALELVVVDVPAASLQWALRDYGGAQIASVLMPGSDPDMVITGEQEQPALAAGYTGQLFVWQRAPIWDGVNWMRWAIVRAAPIRSSNIILWVRTDLHPGAAQEISIEP
jgi:hypothetical protein